MYVQTFLIPIKKRKILADDDIKVIFGNIPRLFQTNKEFLNQLQPKIHNGLPVGELFVSMVSVLPATRNACHLKGFRRLIACSSHTCNMLMTIKEHLKL